MKNQNEAKNVNLKKRILNRQVATELSMDELKRISGGMASVEDLGDGKTTYCGCNCSPDDCGI